MGYTCNCPKISVITLYHTLTKELSDIVGKYNFALFLNNSIMINSFSMNSSWYPCNPGWFGSYSLWLPSVDTLPILCHGGFFYLILPQSVDSLSNSCNNRPFAQRSHVTSFLWKRKLYDFAFKKWLVDHILNKIKVIWFFKPAPLS